MTSAVDEGPERWLSSLARPAPLDLELEPEGAVLSTWADDPWAGQRTGSRPARLPAGRRSAGRPSARFASAGEHTAGAYHSLLMDGALRSGMRAAEQVLAARAEPGPHPSPEQSHLGTASHRLR